MAEKTSVDMPPPEYQPPVDPAMPTTYNTPPPTYTQPSPSKINVNQEYVTSPDGILVIVEGLLSFLLFVCAAADSTFAAWGGGGFIIFVGVTTFLTQGGLFLLYLFHFIYQLPSNIPVNVVEVVYYSVVSLFFFISAIIASTRWPWSAAVRACAMFGWFGLAAYAADTVRKVMKWRSEHPSLPNAMGTTTTTTTTSSTAGNSPNITTEPHY